MTRSWPVESQPEMRVSHILFAFLVAAVWGLNFIAIKFAVTDISPMLASTLRFAGVFVCLLPFFKVIPGLMKPLLTVSVVMGIIHFNFMYWAIDVSGGVSAIAIAAQLGVPFSTLLAVIFLKESVGWKRVSGILLSFLGVVVIAFDPEVFSYVEGVLLMTFGALMYGVSVTMMRHLRQVPAMTLQAWVALAAMLGAFAETLVLESNHMEVLSSAPLTAWGGVLYTIIGASLIGHGGANVLFRHYEISKVSPYFLSSPIFSLVGAMIFLGEEVTIRMVIGASITIVGILIVTLRNNKKGCEDLVATEGSQ